MARRARCTYSTVQVAEALALLASNGGALRRTARQLRLPVMTLAQWRGGAQVYVHPGTHLQSWSDGIRQLWQDSLDRALRASIAIATQAEDPAWLAQQDAHGLGVMYGILQDKARLLTEAARRAGMEQRQVAAPADSDQEGDGLKA